MDSDQEKDNLIMNSFLFFFFLSGAQSTDIHSQYFKYEESGLKTKVYANKIIVKLYCFFIYCGVYTNVGHSSLQVSKDKKLSSV